MPLIPALVRYRASGYSGVNMRAEIRSPRYTTRWTELAQLR
ncbi:MAG: DUF4113 domain-containing protein [Legionella sp.]|nr:DUF4113 domain-containing protein [Legionella sp.]